MRCLFLYLFPFSNFISLVFLYQPGKIVQTPNYPNPYTGKLSQRTTFSVNSTQGVAVVFEQFLASAHDCVIACPLGDQGCSSICGDAMDHGLIPKILRVPGSAAVTIVSIDESDGFPHSGISGKVLSYDLEKSSFFDCNFILDISSGDTFYLISQNYPSTPTASYSECSLSFSTSGSRQGIRFAVYDFYLSASEKFQISGKEGKKGQGDLVTITGFATEDEPIVYYYENTANVTFSIDVNQKSIIQKRFYILVKSYEIVANTNSNGCVGQTGSFTMGLGECRVFGTQDFGKKSYNDNLECGYNFTRQSYDYSMFAIAIQYETEKCCDTMTIDGLSRWEEIYQGFQYSNLFFTYNKALSFLFQSDPVVGGSGFNATVEHIDCTCPSSQFLVKNGIFTSPGYSNSISYCPNILCLPKIEYQDDLYDLQLIYTDVDLRTYSLSNLTDYLSTFDAYDHRIIEMLPGYIGFSTFWSTVSPVSIVFVSNYVSSMPLDMAGRGFSIELNLIKKQFIKETVSFTDDNFFKDISKLDLTSSQNGVGNTYEFTINGRQGHQISMYFFTKTTNQVFIDIFDGDSIDSKKIDNKALYSNVQENGVSFQLRTSAEKAIVRIRGNPTFFQKGNDFQAMITDVKLGDRCGPLMYSLKGESSIANIHLQGQNCYTILHFTDSSYSQTAFMNIWMSKRIDMNIYLGLTTHDSNLIAQRSNDSLPQDLFTNYLVLEYSTNDLINLNYNWGISSGIIARTMQSDETVIIMTADYGKFNSVSLIQEFSVQLEGESNVQTGLRVDFLTDSGKGQSTFTWSNYDAEVLKKSFSPSKKSSTISSCGNKLLVDYTSPGGGSSNGLYLKITRADLRCSHSSLKNLLSMFLFLFVFVFCFKC